MATVHGYAKVYGQTTEGRPTLGQFPEAFRGAILPLLTPVFVIGGFVRGIVTPAESAIIAAFHAPISAAIGEVNVVSVLRDVAIIVIPMLPILLLIITFPEQIVWLPRTLMPGAFH